MRTEKSPLPTLTMYAVATPSLVYHLVKDRRTVCGLFVVTITLGEIEAGNLLADPPDAQKQDDLNRFLNEHFISTALCVEAATRIDYAVLLARIMEKYPRPSQNTKMMRHLFDVGVDIDDLWIVSIAEHNLTVCTQDEMAVIRAAAFDVEFDCWL